MSLLRVRTTESDFISDIDERGPDNLKDVPCLYWTDMSRCAVDLRFLQVR